ncbi:MAG: hypothetical protein E7320_08885 [Clostridiales bacterium]|nr:hypothetical protein [Clostridiales bacterium]
MDILGIIKNLLGGDKELKVADLLTKIVALVKPLLAEGKLGELVQTALGNFGDLGEQLTATKTSLKTATGEAKASLTAQKNDMVAQMKDKGNALLDSLSAESELPEALSGMMSKAKNLLGKL